MKVKKIISIILVLVLLFMMGGCDKVKETLNNTLSHSWKLTSELKTNYSFYSSHFLNEKVGITVGSGGEIHFTKDGGNEWKKGLNNSLCLFDVCMINEKVAWACGNGAYVVKTLNGGSTWKAVGGFGEAEPNHPRYISFIDENTGWIATPEEFELNGKDAKLGYTNDGGKTWNAIELPKGTTELAAIYLRTQNDGYVLDDTGNLYITNDGGKSFSKQSVDLKDINFRIKYAPTIALQFLDAENALICYSNKDGKLQAARSSDGGKTWIKEVMPDMWGGSINLSRDGDILTSTNGGGTLKILSYK